MKKILREEAREAIIEALRDGYDGYYCDLHSEVFGGDYYIIGTHVAKKALEQYDVFDAIKEVLEYEKCNFGEVYTDVTNPEKLIARLFYIIGEDVLREMMDAVKEWEAVWYKRATDETNAAILEALGEE